MSNVTVDQRPTNDGGWTVRVDGSAWAEAYDLVKAQYIAGLIEDDIKAKEAAEFAAEQICREPGSTDVKDLVIRAYMRGRSSR